MRKVFAFAAVAGLLSFASCGEKKAETTETTTTETSMDTTMSSGSMESTMDSASSTNGMMGDSSSMMADTAHKM